MQKELANVWKENLLEDLEIGKVEFGLVEEFLLKLKKKLGRENEESVKVTELRKIEQRGRMMEEFIQEFQRVVRGSRYKRRVLVENFKREMNEMIRRKLIEAEKPSTNIKQWYKHATNLDKH